MRELRQVGAVEEIGQVRGKWGGTVGDGSMFFYLDDVTSWG